MSNAMELLSTEVCDDILNVDLESRMIVIPNTVQNLGVESDDSVRVLHFQVPRYYCEVDLSTFVIRINYKHASGAGGYYDISTPTVEENLIKFDWKVARQVVVKKGNVLFNVCFREFTGSTVTREFNTTVATLPVLEGLEPGEELVKEHIDVFEQMLRDFSNGEWGGVSIPNGAEVGQIIQVSAVDENDIPTEWTAVDMPSGGVNVINNNKYGIVAADYVTPFTADMFKVAYNNGVGIQNAIDDAKVAGQTEITLAPGNYPLCYHGTADQESNPIINACGINFYGYGVKLYVIYEDVEGTNPYFTGTTPGLSYGSIIETDSDVCGFHLVGERRFRVDASTKYRASSYGISLVSTTNGNTIRDCLIECVSGDGIGAGQHMVQLAGWQNETFTSVEWDDATQTYVESNYKFVSQSHGGDWIDKTKPLLFRCATYFLYAVGPLTVRCFDSEGTHIGVVQFWQGEYFYLPENTASWRLELSREVYHESTVTETFSFWLGNGTYCGTKIINCESRLNQRGGMSNLPNDVLVKDCYIHDNGNARDGMVQYYDTTRFGIDIEDIWINRITIEGTRITDSFHGFLFRCGSVVLKNSVFSGSSGAAVISLNFCRDFYAEQCIFDGTVSFRDSETPHGEKVAIGCTFKGTKPDALYVVGEDTDALQTHLEKLQAQVDALPMSLNKTGLVKHADFTSADPMVDKASGEVYTAFNNKTLLFDKHGVYSEESGAHINCEDFELADNFTLEVVTYKSFGSGVFTAANAGIKFHNPSITWSKYAYLGNSMFTPKYTQIDKDGTLATLNNANFWTDMGFEDIAHFVYRCEGNTVTCKLNGHDLYTADGAKETSLTRVTVGLLAVYMQSGNESRLQEIRYYDRALTDDEASRSFTYQKQKYAGTAADSGNAALNAALNAATATDLGGVMADPAEETDTQPVRIGADNKLYTAPGGSGGGGGETIVAKETTLASGTTATGTAANTQTATGLTVADLRKWKMFNLHLWANGQTGYFGIVLGKSVAFYYSGSNMLWTCEWVDTARTVLRFTFSSGTGMESATPYIKKIYTSNLKGVTSTHLVLTGNDTDEVKVHTGTGLTVDLKWAIIGLLKYE